MTVLSVCAFYSVVFILCISTSLSVSEWESNRLRLLLSEQCDSVQVCAGLPGNADCERSPRGLFFLPVSDKHFRTPHARRPLKGIRLEAQTSAFLNITTLLFLLWGNAITKWAKFQLACVIHPNRHYPSLFAPKLICGDVISHITVTICPCWCLCAQNWANSSFIYCSTTDFVNFPLINIALRLMVNMCCSSC